MSINKMVKKIFFVVSIFLVAEIGLAANTINYTDATKPIIVNKSAPAFVIIVQSNPTTGYSWSLKNYDANIIEPVKRKYVAPHTKLIGAGGYEKWVFRVLPKGFTVPQISNIVMIYSRQWEQTGAEPTNFKVVTNNDD